MTKEESFILVAAFRYASGRHTYAMEIVASHICKLVDTMDSVEISELLCEINRRRKDVSWLPWDIAEEETVGKLEEKLRRKLEEFK